jgi:hypothetical protein
MTLGRRRPTTIFSNNRISSPQHNCTSWLITRRSITERGCSFAFFARQFIDAISPSNFPATNPGAEFGDVKRFAFEYRGLSYQVQTRLMTSIGLSQSGNKRGNRGTLFDAASRHAGASGVNSLMYVSDNEDRYDDRAWAANTTRAQTCRDDPAKTYNPGPVANSKARWWNAFLQNT